jgi:FAD/FMN-containing dehydrogenase
MKRREFLQGSLGATVAASLNGLAAAQTGAPQLPSVTAVQGDGKSVTVSGAALQELREALHGRLLLPQDDGYEEARHIVMRRFDRRPAFIVQATGAADVATAIDFARDRSLLLAIKGGGHSECGVSATEGGMMIDLSPMRAVRVDARAKRAWVAGGTLAGLVDHETQSHGLIVPMGDKSTVGVGGLATGGGFGLVSRRFGLTLDAIRSVDIVTARGELVHASDTESPDLFWAVRGGGGNFGIVTEFEFELYPMRSRVVGGAIEFPFAEAHQVLSAYSDLMTSAPDELYVDCFVNVFDTMDASTVHFGICYSGDARDAERVIAPIQSFGRMLSNTVAAQSYLALQGSDQRPQPRSVSNTNVVPREYYYRAGFATGIDKDLVEAVAAGAQPARGRNTTLLFQPAGGAIMRVGKTATAFSHRSITHDTILLSSWVADATADRHRHYAEQFWHGVKNHLRGFYNNDMAGAVAPSEVAVNFGENYPRLLGAKRTYDPDNLFRLNANIDPKVS